MSFPENLQFLRTRSETTQEQLAEQLGVSRQSVSKWESGQSFPEMETLIRICDLYGTDLDTLLRGSAERSLAADTVHYDRAMNRFSRQISFSVGAILAAVGIMCLLNGFAVPELISVAFLLFVITIAVVVIVAGGIQHDAFHKKYPVIEDFYTQDEKDAFRQKFVWLIAGSVGAILFGVVLLLLFFFVFPEQEPYESVAACVFFLILACAVTALIYGGMQEEKYKIHKYNRENNPTPEEKKRSDLIGTISACIMLVATAVYVSLGFTKELWGTAWWVFPVGGILCGVASVILDPHRGEDD